MKSGKTGFEPTVWPEEPPPMDAVHCSQCELERHRNRVIWGEGASGAPLMAILDNPGARENTRGEEFVCATRIVLQRAVRDAGLDRDDIYVTYLLKCRPVRSYDKPLARQACSGWLLKQIREKKPKIVVLLGLVVAQTVLSLSVQEMSRLRGRWHSAFDGIPAIVTYHPLAVHRRPNLYASFVSDLERARSSI